MPLAFLWLEAYKLIALAINIWKSNMRAEELKNEIRKLEVSEILTLIEEVWDDIPNQTMRYHCLSGINAS